MQELTTFSQHIPVSSSQKKKKAIKEIKIIKFKMWPFGQ